MILVSSILEGSCVSSMAVSMSFDVLVSPTPWPNLQHKQIIICLNFWTPCEMKPLVSIGIFVIMNMFVLGCVEVRLTFILNYRTYILAYKPAVLRAQLFQLLHFHRSSNNQVVVNFPSYWTRKGTNWTKTGHAAFCLESNIFKQNVRSAFQG